MPNKNGRPSIPKATRTHLWLRAGGRCEFRGCNKILYEDDVTQDPINGSHIAHIISWTETGPRGDKELSLKLATDISNLMLTCPEHNHLIDKGENIEKYTVSFLREMKAEHERSIRELTRLAGQLPKRVIVLKSMIHGQRPAITEKEEADAMLPFYPQKDRIDIDLCDIFDLAIAKGVIDEKVRKYIANSDGSELYAAFIMATIPLGCYLGYAIGNKLPVQTFQHFRDTEDWKWRDGGEGYTVELPDIDTPCPNVKLFVKDGVSYHPDRQTAQTGPERLPREGDAVRSMIPAKIIRHGNPTANKRNSNSATSARFKAQSWNLYSGSRGRLRNDIK